MTRSTVVGGERFEYADPRAVMARANKEQAGSQDAPEDARIETPSFSQARIQATGLEPLP